MRTRGLTYVPEAVLHRYLLVKVVIDDEARVGAVRRLEADFQVSLSDVHVAVSGLGPSRNGNRVSHVLQRLNPGLTVLESEAVTAVWHQPRALVGLLLGNIGDLLLSSLSFTRFR